MEQPFTAQIFLSDNRLMSGSPANRTYSTLSSGDKQNTHTDFSGLFVLDDEELAGGGCVDLQPAVSCYLLLLPVTGDLLFSAEQRPFERLNVGELKIIRLEAAEKVQLTNPYEGDHVSFIRLMISVKPGDTIPCSSTHEFDLVTHQNQLLQLSPAQLPFLISLGRFQGRKEYTYQLQNCHNKLFCFVIAGAFELENRLLQMRDGLAISGLRAVELEALSEGALLLTIELP